MLYYNAIGGPEPVPPMRNRHLSSTKNTTRTKRLHFYRNRKNPFTSGLIKMPRRHSVRRYHF